MTTAFKNKVKQDLIDIQNPQKSILRNILILIATLAVFFGFGFLNYSITKLSLIIVVLIIHESGHFIGMKMFGYKDVQMFFIPMLGAAVSGTESNPTSTRKAVVALMGPLPGIIIGIILMIIFFRTENQLYSDAAKMFLFINGFNMLPIHPLDGGRFFDHLLFSRHPIFEIIFKVLTGLILGLLAYELSAPILGIFALLALITIKTTYTIANIAHGLKKDANIIIENTQEIPESVLTNILEKLDKNITTKFKQNSYQKTDLKSKIFANHVQTIWQRICNKPASVMTTIMLIVLYIPFFMIGLFLPFGF